jgi:hypothetical protein
MYSDPRIDEAMAYTLECRTEGTDPRVLTLKLFLVPSLICAITLAGRRWGPAVAGWLSGFPIVSAPVLFFIAVEQGTEFAGNAAAATLSCVPAVLLFSTTYAWLATRANWMTSLAGALLAYFAGVVVLYLIAPPVYVSAPLVYAIVWFAPRFFPAMQEVSALPTFRGTELVLRMLAGAALVLALTYFAADLGPKLSGLFAMFPVLGIVLAVFSHRQAGAAFTIRLLRGMVFGFYAFTSFCLVVALTIVPLGIGIAFAFALATASLVQAVVKRYVRMTVG